MGWRGISLVIAAFASACAPDLPRGIQIESGFSADEAALASDAIARANKVLGAQRAGSDILVDLGRFDDPDGFHDDDFGDDIAAIYPLDPQSAEYRWLRDTNERDYEGYGTRADILVAFRFSAAPTDAERRHFRQVVMHELGHFLGLPHSSQRAAIMYSASDRLDLDTYTAADQQLFCLVYGC